MIPTPASHSSKRIDRSSESGPTSAERAVASLAIFLGIAFEMSFVRWRYLLRVRTVLGITPNQRAGKGSPPGTDEELAAALDSRIPVVNFAVGVGGIAILVWLMMMKPF